MNWNKLTGIENKITAFELTPYSIKLTSPWKAAHGIITTRSGFLLSLIIDKNYTVIGECAPLPAIGTESCQQALDCLANTLPGITGQTIGQIFYSLQKDSDLAMTPAANFALETALLLFVAQHYQCSVATLLNQNAGNIVNVNTMLGPLDETVIDKAKTAERAGYSILKIKVGLDEPNAEIAQLIKLIKHIQPTTRLRLDANRCWSLNTAKDVLNRLEKYTRHIDSIEEPLEFFEPVHYRNLQGSTAIALALDESFTRQMKLDEFPVRRLVLKPMAAGGLINSFHIARQADKQGIELILSSCIETAHGLWALTWLAAAVNNGLAHGLGTASWLTDTLIAPPEIINAKIRLN